VKGAVYQRGRTSPYRFRGPEKESATGEYPHDPARSASRIGVQTGNQQAAAGLDRHRDRLFRRVTVVGQHIHKLPIAGGVIADAQLCFDAATAVDERHIVMVFRPVDPAEQFGQPRSFIRWVLLVASLIGPCDALIPGLNRSAISLAVRDTSEQQGPQSVSAFALDATVDERSSCCWLTSRTLHDPGRAAGISTWRRGRCPHAAVAQAAAVQR